jgi:acetolactate synthase I/II/III large subunit
MHLRVPLQDGSAIAPRYSLRMNSSATPRIAGHVLVEALVAQGIDTCFGVPGESFLAVLDGFHEHRDRIRFIACRQEGGAAFMAEAQGKLSGRPGVCFVTRGPGATNASIGVHTAFQDSTPMVLFIGQIARDQRDREAFQEMDYRQMFGPGTLGLAKWAAEIDTADRLPEYVARAFHTAMQGRPGPVVLSLPEDMLVTPTAAAVLPRAEPALAWPAPGGVRALREMLLAAERPLVIAGGSGWDGPACAALQRFAENWQLPVACGWRFQNSFDNHHPLYAGDVGLGINPALAARVRAADLIIALGVRLGEMTTGSYTLIVPPRPTQKLVHIHPGPEELGRVYAADLLLQAAMPAATKALEALDAPASVPWAEHTRAANADHRANVESPAVEPMDLAEVVRTAQRVLPADTIYTNGAGNFAGWMGRFGQFRGVQHHGRTHLAPTSGAMGYGVPAAVAAALLHPQRQVFNLAGDGDFLMNGQEMVTATGYGAKRLISVVVDNGTFGTIRMHQERDFPGRVSGTDLFNPDFAALARACGWAGERIDRTAEFEPALQRSLQANAEGRPALIHLKLDSEVSTNRSTLSAIRAAALRRQPG